MSLRQLILAAGGSTIDVLSLGAPGQAQHIQTLDIAGPAKSAGLTTSKYSAELAVNLLTF